MSTGYSCKLLLHTIRTSARCLTTQSLRINPTPILLYSPVISHLNNQYAVPLSNSINLLPPKNTSFLTKTSALLVLALDIILYPSPFLISGIQDGIFPIRFHSVPELLHFSDQCMFALPAKLEVIDPFNFTKGNILVYEVNASIIRHPRPRWHTPGFVFSLLHRTVGCLP